MTIAARISQISLLRDDWKALAAPRKVVVSEAGTPICCSAFLISCTAPPRATPGAVSNEMLAAGNWLTWLTCSGPSSWRTVAKADSGIGLPALDCM